MKKVYKLTNENSRPMTKTRIITASPFILELYPLFSNLIFDEHPGLPNENTNCRKSLMNLHSILIKIFPPKYLVYA